MEFFEDGVLAFFLGEVVEARGSLFARRQRTRLLLPEEVFFLAETMETPSGAVVFWGGRGWSEVQGLLLNAFCEELVGGVGGVGTREEVPGDVFFFLSGHFGGVMVRRGREDGRFKRGKRVICYR